ncbi:MAG: cell division protein FtsW [Crocinitomicaceae bacterium]|nr:cell division protein FtsW [Crocinitomicaceae bacterium]|tara:strand:+ start:933 stop:2102 length:1170 start_codon:yes stop_codon:yes gene_type:complete
MSNLIQRIKDRLEGDKVIWMVALILSVWSLLSVYSSISSLAVKAGGNSTKFLTKQGILLLMGLGVIYIIHRINYKYFARLANVVYSLAVIALILTLVVGSDINDAKRWLEIPFVGLTLQTSDFAKVALVMWVAKELHLRQDYIEDFRKEVIPILIRIALVCGLILPADLSTALMLGLVTIGMLAVEVPWSGIFRIGGLVTVLAVGLYGVGKASPDLFPRFETWTNRIEQHIGFTTGDSDHITSEGEYQIELAQVAIHNGGLFPSGPGTGTSRNFLPHPYSDMIYAFIIEEWGAIIGGLGLLLIYMILLYRTILAAKNCDRPFGSYLAMGLGMMITIQALINMSVAVRLFPTTGQPLPLVSYGGTSILFTCLSIGMILAVSRAPLLTSKR